MNWFPKCKDGSKILILGASGGIGRAVLGMLEHSKDTVVGLHYQNPNNLPDRKNYIPLQKTLADESDCRCVLDEFIEKSGGLDILLNLAGGIHFSGPWMEMPEEAFLKDISLNLNMAFLTSRIAMQHMAANNSWGRIILTGTESALHGGSETSLPYAVAKRGVECLVQGLAREGAKDRILVNGIRLGYVKSGFHERWHGRTEAQMVERASLVPLKRGAHPDEAAALIVYLMSEWSEFITGQMISLSGGDWL